MATIHPAAGPLGIPAAVMHPDDSLPKTWRLVSTWEHDGERGAYVEWANAPGSWRRDGEGEWSQVVYRTDAPRRGSSHVGHAICYATKQLACPSLAGAWGNYGTPHAEALASARRAYYAERGQDIERLSWIADGLYALNGKPGPTDPFGGTPTPSIDAMPEPSPSEDQLRREAESCGLVALIHPIAVHPDQPWPDSWHQVTHNGELWAMSKPATWVRITLDAKVDQLTARGLGLRFDNRRRKMHSRIYAIKNPIGGVGAAPAAKAAPVAPQRPLEAPPAPGVERARWLGERITQMTGDERSDYPAHTRRRIAAHRALALVTGYEAESPDNDGCDLHGPLSLHLAGLNELARRTFGETGDTDALL